MIAEIGHALLWLALGCAVLQAASGLTRGWLEPLTVPAAILQGWLWLFIAASLAWIFWSTDLSVAGVAATSDAALPPVLKLAAVVVQDGGWLIVATALVAWAGATLAFAAGRARRTIGAAGAVATVLTLSLLLVVAPFARLVPAPTAGAGFPVAARAWLASLSPPGRSVPGAAVIAVTPVAGPDSTGVAAEVRSGSTVLVPEWRETIRPRAGFAVADSSLGRDGWVSAAIYPSNGGWRVVATELPLWWAGAILVVLAAGGVLVRRRR